jgi:hypothetical protein
MAFSDVAAQEGPGAVWLLDVSFDDFATVSYRWSTVSISYGGNQYEGRISERGIGKISRSFGRENTPTAGTVSLLLDNTDFAADWLVEPSTVASQVLRARFKLTLLLYQNGNPSGAQAKVCGKFKCLDFPIQDAGSVALQLADDTMGFFNEPLTSPTIREWKDDAGSDVDNCPLVDEYLPVPNIDSDWDTPLPLAFGDGWLNCFAAALLHRSEGDETTPTVAVGDMYSSRAIPVCVTTSTGAVNDDDVRALRAVFGQDVTLAGEKWSGGGSTISIPKTFTIPQGWAGEGGAPGTVRTIWEPLKTQTITKDGVAWKILWVRFDLSAYIPWFSIAFSTKIGGVPTGGGSFSPVAYPVPESPAFSSGSRYGAAFAAFSHFQVRGFPLSARTVTDREEQLAVNVIKDLISYYSFGDSTDLDTDSFTAALQMSPVAVRGIVLPVRPISTRFKYSKSVPPSDALSSGQLRQTLSDICQSADLDLAMTWDGKIAVFSSYFSFANLTATLPVIDETRCDAVRRRIPSKGERWAPYNRVTIIDPSGTPHGPFDNPDPDVDWGIALDRTLQGKWLSPFQPVDPQYSSMIWFSARQLESRVRPVITFVTDREGLSLDLGSLFEWTWTRGGAAGPYNSATVFRVESMTLDPETLALSIEAVWVDDLRSEYPYLLDNETFVVRVAASGGRTVTVTDASDTVTFSSGNIITDGVVAGDILRLTDATQADNVFSRFRDIRIASINDASSLKVTSADLDFDAPGGTAVASWEVRRGVTTYPDSSSDPTNYPNDGLMYGKACNDSDAYSAGIINKLG